MMALRAATALALAAPCGGASSAFWGQLGRDAFRSSATSATTLPFPATVMVDVLDPTTAYGYSPLVGAGTVVGVAVDGCNVTFFDRSATTGAPLAWWSPCSLPGGAATNALASAPVLNEAGTELLAATRAGQVYGISAARDDSLGQVVWGPVAVGGALSPFPLLLNSTAVLAALDGSLSYLSLLDGGVTPGQPAQLCGPGDSVPGGATAFEMDDSALAGSLRAGGRQPGVVVVSAAGCISGFNSSGALAWTLPAAAGVAGNVTAPPTVDRAARRLYYAHSGGFVCCVSTAAGGNASALRAADAPQPCAAWPSQCVALPGATPPLAAGLALSPASFDFHGGEVYAADAAGVLFVVRAANGGVGYSAGGASPFTAPGAVFAAPVVLPNAWGPDSNGLLLVSAGNASAAGDDSAAGACGAGSPAGAACIVALDAGNNGAHDDDDAQDDDYAATLGWVWQVPAVPGAGTGGSGSRSASASPAPGRRLQQAQQQGQRPQPLLHLGGQPVVTQLPVATAPGIAVTGEGHVLVPTSAGLYVVYQTGSPPANAPDERMLEAVVLGAVGAGVLALGGALVCVARQRRARALQAAARSPAPSAAFTARGSVAVEGSDARVRLLSGEAEQPERYFDAPHYDNLALLSSGTGVGSAADVRRSGAFVPVDDGVLAAPTSLTPQQQQQQQVHRGSVSGRSYSLNLLAQ